MEDLLEQIKAWGFWRELPAEACGCSLKIEQEQCGNRYHLFSYRRADGCRWVRAYYDLGKKSFFLRIAIGLTEFNDISYFSQSLAELEGLLRRRLETTLREYMSFSASAAGVAVREKKLLQWPYAASLPQEVDGFRLLLRPEEPVKVINGSYLILDYSDLAAQSSLVLYYNVYRDEFFGELRVAGSPELVGDFDAKTLAELEQKLDQRLSSVLAALRERLEKEHGR